MRLAVITLLVIASSILPAQAQVIAPEVVLKAAVAAAESQVFVSLDNADDLLGISGSLVIPQGAFNVTAIKRGFEVCTLWDEPPAFTDGRVRFDCGRGAGSAVSGELLRLTLAANSSFDNDKIVLSDLVYLDKSGELRKLADVEVALTNPQPVAQTLGQYTRSGLTIGQLLPYVLAFMLLLLTGTLVYLLHPPLHLDKASSNRVE